MPTFLADFRERWEKSFEPKRLLTAMVEKSTLKSELLNRIAELKPTQLVPQDLIDAAKIVCGKDGG